MINLSPKDEYTELCEIYSLGLRKTLDNLLFGYCNNSDMAVLYQLITMPKFEKAFTDGDILYLQFCVIKDKRVCLTYPEQVGHIPGIINFIKQNGELTPDSKDVVFNEVSKEIEK